MSRWVYCHICGCTGLHRDHVARTEYPCPNGCDGGRVYEDSNREWFNRLVDSGAVIREETRPEHLRAART